LQNKYARLAAGGETGLITNRGHVVAELVPLQPGHPLSVDTPTQRGKIK
jgi:antitoxin (DNA-binding transcriptional repressor) of toxin-antitoxin stability system